MEEVTFNTGPDTEVTTRIHSVNYPAWIFDEKSLRIVDANYLALEFCMYDHQEIIGLSIADLWHGEDLSDIIENLEIHAAERSFYGNLKHKKKNGEIVMMRVQATRHVNHHTTGEVHLVPKKMIAL